MSVMKRDREQREQALIALAARRWRVAIVLTIAMMAVYFGFLLLVAFAKPTAGVLVAPGLSLGILLGALVIVTAWIVTGIYVRWANTRYDDELASLRQGAFSDAKNDRADRDRDRALSDPTSDGKIPKKVDESGDSGDGS